MRARNPLLIQRFFISVRVRPCTRALKRGIVINCAIFLRWQWHSKSSLHWRAPSSPQPPPSLTTTTFFYSLPHSLSLFLALQESLEKKRGFYSASPCTPSPSPGFLKPIHALSVCFQSPISALWGLSPSLLLLLPLLVFLRLGGRSFLLRGFPVIAECNN